MDTHENTERVGVSLTSTPSLKSNDSVTLFNDTEFESFRKTVPIMTKRIMNSGKNQSVREEKFEKEGSRKRIELRSNSLDSVVDIFLPFAVVFWTWMRIKEGVGTSIQVNISCSVNVTSD